MTIVSRTSNKKNKSKKGGTRDKDLPPEPCRELYNRKTSLGWKFPKGRRNDKKNFVRCLNKTCNKELENRIEPKRACIYRDRYYKDYAMTLPNYTKTLIEDFDTDYNSDCGTYMILNNGTKDEIFVSKTDNSAYDISFNFLGIYNDKTQEIEKVSDKVDNCITECNLRKRQILIETDAEPKKKKSRYNTNYNCVSGCLFSTSNPYSYDCEALEKFKIGEQKVFSRLDNIELGNVSF